MDAAAVLLTLLHILVFAYWLGGDIGAFRASLLLGNADRPAAARMAAATILNDVDLAPRIALLLTLPSGVALAAAKGWIIAPLALVLGLLSLAAIWVFVVFRLHLAHGPDWLRRADFWARCAFAGGLAVAAAAGYAGAIDLPLFVELKLLLLAFCVSMGLIVRMALKPFPPAIAALARGEASPESDRIIRRTLAHARPAVIAIWVGLVAAALLGLLTPV
jgi:hypothetical protein